ncbi:hypothetical protein EZS27_011080 [termite gut metagenome]|uniref:Uncharacterized protein n=1 Tax=termite gut metagenome TaxID=433724 RepID=A0A5J4S4W8_9ZZZZ
MITKIILIAMICCKEKQNLHWFSSYCQHWQRLDVKGIKRIKSTCPKHIYISFLDLINTHSMERINKATLFENLLF